MGNSFTDQQPRVATEEDVKACWGMGKPGERFRCYLCGYKFQVGDRWRWVYAGSAGLTNFLVCAACDGDDVLERWRAANEEARQRFWWLYARIDDLARS